MQSPEEIAENSLFVRYTYYDGWFVHLASGTVGPYPSRDEAEQVANLIAEHLIAALASYGAACAAAERERAAQIAEATITDLVSRMDSDSEEYYSAVCFHIHQLAAAIRRLP